MIYDETTVAALFDESLQAAKSLLMKLQVHSGREPKFLGLSGWVFEQTIQHCLRKELKLLNFTVKPVEQVSLGGRAKVDLLMGTTAIEIKSRGLFGFNEADTRRYKKHQTNATKKGYRYVFLSKGERHGPYRTGIMECLGKDNVIFLDQGEEWKRLIGIIKAGLNAVCEL